MTTAFYRLKHKQRTAKIVWDSSLINKYDYPKTATDNK